MSGFTTIYQSDLANLSVSGNIATTYSFRQFLNSGITLSTGGYIRIGLVNISTSENVVCTHASLTVKGTATAPNTQLTPAELKFGGASGFTIDSSPGGNVFLFSDWLPAAGLMSTDVIAIILDIASNFDNTIDNHPPANFLSCWQKPSTTSYNSASVSGYSNSGAKASFLIEIDTCNTNGPVTTSLKSIGQDCEVTAISGANVITSLSRISQVMSGVEYGLGNIVTALGGLSQNLQASCYPIGTITTSLSGIGQEIDAIRILPMSAVMTTSLGGVKQLAVAFEPAFAGQGNYWAWWSNTDNQSEISGGSAEGSSGGGSRQFGVFMS